jgi:long-chain fatty acid transport protein
MRLSVYVLLLSWNCCTLKGLKMLRKAGFATFIFASSAAVLPVQAGGLWLTEYNQPAQGRAGAGDESGNGDASDAFFNPASMSRHTESQLMVNGGLILPRVEFDVDQGSVLNGDGDGGEAGSLTPSASVFYSRPVNERWSIGLSGLALTGAVLDYDDDWVGRFQAQDVTLLVIGAIPSVAFKATDKLSLGFAVPIMYSKLELDIAIPELIAASPDGEGKAEIDGDDVQVAASASFHYQFSGRTALGGRATSKFEFDYGGNIEARYIGQVGVNTEMTLASLVRIGLSHDFNDRWSGYATWGWDNWSEMNEVLLSTNSRGLTLPRNWEDTYHYALGADYRLDDQWTLRAGIAYDTSPVDEDDRTTDMPMDEQIRYAIGADYLRDSGMKVSGSLVYADYGDAEIENSGDLGLAGFSGQYQTNEIWFASLSFNWPLGGGPRR